MIIRIDIDETICITPKNRDYSKAVPIPENINKANKLFEDGHIIIYWTSRGSTTEINWREVTTQQFKEWGVKYHKLEFGKPFYDMFIDDKVLNTNNWV